MKIPKGVIYLGLASFVTDLAHEMIYPLLPVFFTQELGAGVLFLGFFEGFAEFVASVTKYVGGRWSDKTGRREPFVVGGYFLANVVRPFIGLATAPWQAVVVRAIDRTGKGLRTSPRDAWLGGMTSHETRGRIFGFHRAMDHAGATVGPLVATAFLFFFPGELRLLFMLTILPGLVGVYFAFRATHVQPAERAPQPRPHAMFRDLPRPLKSYLSLLAVFTLGMSSDAFLLLKLKLCGVPEVALPALWGGLHVVKSATTVLGGWLSDVVGRKTTLLKGWVVYAGFYAAFGFVQSPWAVTALFLSYGVFFGLTEGPEKALIADLAPPDRQGEAFGTYHLIVGAVSLPASVLFGFVWKMVGASTAFYSVAILSIVCACVLAFLSLPEDRAEAK
jgi:MFS family permease